MFSPPSCAHRHTTTRQGAAAEGRPMGVAEQAHGRAPGGPPPSGDDEIAALRAQVSQLEALVHELLGRTAATPGAATPGASTPTTTAPTTTTPTTATPAPGRRAARASARTADPARALDRRSLLRVAGAGAAATAAVTATGLATAGPAAANNGNPILVGTTTNGTASTYLQDVGSAAKDLHVLCATDAETFPPTSTAACVAGEARNNTVDVGVVGSTTQSNSYGVLGKLLGLNVGAGAAVWGNGGFAGTGVKATASAGALVPALHAAGGIGAEIAGDTTNLHLVAGGAAAPSRGDSAAGYVLVDQNNDLWVGVGIGGWRKLGGPTTAGALHVLDSTTRVYDSRPGTQPPNGTKTRFQSGNERLIDTKIGGAVPAGARAVMINATATNTNPGGFFAFFKNGTTWPKNSSLNWGVVNTTVATTTVVALDTAATFKAHMEGAGGADLIIDVIGYYR